MAYDDALPMHLTAVIHGLDASQMTIHREERAIWLHLTRDHNISIRISLLPHGAELNRSRGGLYWLIDAATQIAEEISQVQRDAQTQAEATYAELADTPAARAEADHPEPTGPHGPR